MIDYSNYWDFGKIIEIIPSGIFNKVMDEDAMIVNYLIDVKIKGGCCYLNDVTLKKLFDKLDSVHVDYSYNNVIHNFINNNYLLYLGYSYKKKDIEERYLYELKHIEDL